MGAELRWPSSYGAIEAIQRERKRRAVEQAMRAPFFRKRLSGIRLDRLDDPQEWAKIPLLTKDQLRAIPSERFHDEFCVAPRADVVEYWRSGGVTGRPLFYPRSAIDMEASIMCFRRAFEVVGATHDDLVHVSFPLGIHPVAHLYARAAEDLGIGTIWCGSGSNTPSLIQLELIRDLKPTIWAGMGSYGLHLANLAEANGIDLAASSVEKIIVAAEPLSPAKRQKLERAWGATVSDQFGMTEGALVSVQSPGHDGLHVWSDLFFCEVIDETSGEPVGDGEVGSLVITALCEQQCHPVPALELGRPHQHHQQGAWRWSLVDLSGDAPRPPHGRLLQGARRQHQSQRAGRPDVLQSKHRRFQSRGLLR